MVIFREEEAGEDSNENLQHSSHVSDDESEDISPSYIDTINTTTETETMNYDLRTHHYKTTAAAREQ